jgi:putative DNA primase/helicase
VPPSKTVWLHRTDIGNAERLVAHYRHDLLYCDTRGGWHTWDGRRYREDSVGKVELLAKNVVRAIFAEVALLDDAYDREEHTRHAFASEKDARIKAMLARARVEEPFARTADELDSDDWVFNVLNGTLDLRTGELRSHRREDRITRLAPVEFDPNARCEDWERFLKEALGDDDELVGWLQRLSGYSLTGDTSEDRVPILFGPGGTGKSTILETLKCTWGSYARTISWETLLQSKHGGGGGPRDEIARLAGTRLVIASEVDPNREFNAGLLKSLSGDDTIAARFLYKGTFEFRPTFKLVLAANHLPALGSGDSGSWRRVVVVPLMRKPFKAEKSLRARLRRPDARAAVLAWALRGLADWHNRGLGTATAIERHTEQYRERESLVDRFIDECCEVHVDASAPARDLYEVFTAFAASIAPDREPMSDVRFGRELNDRGFLQVSGCWSGKKGKGRAGLRLRGS